MKRVIILLMAVQAFVVARAQESIFDDALFSTDGTAILLRDNNFHVTCDADFIKYTNALYDRIWETNLMPTCFSNNTGCYFPNTLIWYKSEDNTGRMKDTDWIIQTDDSVFIVNYKKDAANDLTLVTQDGHKTNLKVEACYSINGFKKKYNLYIHPKDFTKQLVVKIDTLKIDKSRLQMAFDVSNQNRMNYDLLKDSADNNTYRISYFLKNELLFEDTLKSRVNTSIKIDKDGGSYSTLLLYDSISQLFMLKTGIYINCEERRIKDENYSESGEYSLAIIYGETEPKFISGKLHQKVNEK